MAESEEEGEDPSRKTWSRSEFAVTEAVNCGTLSVPISTVAQKPAEHAGKGKENSV
jgi:hypothetical protein